MKLEITPTEATTALKLHELGTIYIQGEESSYTPEDFPQRETRTLRVRIELWEKSYKLNKALVDQVREALKLVSCKAKWQGENELNEEFEDIGEGPVYMDNYVDIVDLQWPEANTWGEAEMVVTFGLRYNVMDIASDKTHLQAKFQILHAVGTPLTLGNVFVFRDGYRQSRYSEMKGIVERASGNLTLAGEFMSDRNKTPKERRIELKDKLVALKTQVRGQSGHLTFGPDDVKFFDANVKVDTLEAEIDQASWTVRWTMTVSYTVFPNEDGYAASDFKIEISEEDETGDRFMGFSGTIGAATEQLAIAKLAAVRTAALAANSFTAGYRIESKIEKGFLNTDDTQNPDFNPANSSLPQKNVFTILTFTERFRKRMSDVLNYSLQIVDADDTKTGLITRGYSGHVVATGATDIIAYQTAADKARELGDNKYDFRMSGRLTRNDRKLTNGAAEHLSLDFDYQYQLKGNRIWIELSAEETQETFGDNALKVSGFVVAKDRATAEEAYKNEVLALYDGQLIRSQGFTESKNIIETGTYSPDWVGSGQFAEMFIRLDFGLTIWKPKAAGTYSIKFGIHIKSNFVKLTRDVNVTGSFYGGPDVLTAVESSAPGNKLDAFLSAFSFGKLLETDREFTKEKVGDTILAQLGVSFTNTYFAKLTAAQQILECHITEAITYSGVRWNFAPLPDGPSVPQDCGIEPGSRTVSGTVTAATEAAAMTYVKKIKATPFPTGIGGGAAPAERYEGQASRTTDFEFVPLEEGIGRGTGANVQIWKVAFSFPETLVDYPWRDN